MSEGFEILLSILIGQWLGIGCLLSLLIVFLIFREIKGMGKRKDE